MNNTLDITHFDSKASQKKALDSISRQYDKIRREVSNAICQKAPEDTRPETHRHIHIANEKAWIAEHGELPKGVKYYGTSIIFPETKEQKLHNSFYYGVPDYVHHIREKHRKIWEYAGEQFDFNVVLGLAVARDYIKSLPIIKKAKVEKSEGKRTERSAKYWGVCQICGKEHKVDIKTGLLAEHGYTIDNGWYNGSCVGSAQLPLNVSCDFLKAELKKVEAEFESLADKADKEIHHTQQYESYNWETRQKEIKTRYIYVGQVKSQLSALIADWKPKVENWKPFPLRPIKYDN